MTNYVLIAVPLFIQTVLIFFLGYWLARVLKLSYKYAAPSALIGACWWELVSPVEVRTTGGEILKVHFSRQGERFEEVFLEGDTVWVYDAHCVDEMGE